MDDPSHHAQSRKGDRVSIFLDDLNLEGYSLEPVAVALYSNGFKVIGRSKKLYRPRGFYSLEPEDRLLLTRIGDEYLNPCEVYCRDGQKIELSLSTPFLVNFFSPFLNGYFQHRRLLRNRFLWRLAVDKIRQFANHPDIRTVKVVKAVKTIQLESDVVIIGGGLAGLTAAYTVSQLGLRTLLIDKSLQLGGRLRYDYLDVPGISMPREQLLENIISRISLLKNLSILTKTIFAGFFEDYPIAYSQEERSLYILKAKAYIIATGQIDIPCVFRNNDLPGIFSGSTVLEMVNMYGVKPGERGLVIGFNQNSLRVAEQLKQLGINVALVDYSEPEKIQYSLSSIGECFGNVEEIEALGKTCVKNVKIVHDGRRDELKADFIVCSAFPSPDVRILNQLNSKMVFIDGVGFVPVHDEYMRLKDNIFIAGGASGTPYSILHMKEGEISALSAAYMLGVKEAESATDEKIREYKEKLREMNVGWKSVVFEFSRGKPIGDHVSNRPPTLFIEKPRKDAFICFCEDITAEDVSRTVYEKGYVLLELVKRSLGVCTGRCQGRLCMVNTALYVSYLSKLDPNRVGLSRARAPTTPIPLYAFIGGGDE
ncbi:MAG: FAD-dependent oxidoreductase [Nitrososphaerota archaeon]